MIYASRNQSDELDIYVSMLNDVIHSKGEEKRELFKRIIQTAFSVINGSMSFYQIDNDIYDIVKLVVNKYSGSVQDLDQINDSVLSNLMETLQKETALA